MDGELAAACLWFALLGLLAVGLAVLGWTYWDGDR